METNNFQYPIDSSPFGKEFKGWLADWWTLNLGISAEKHPNYVNLTSSQDNTKDPSKCFLGEDVKNNVLFLGVPSVSEKFPVRNCDVPSDKAIFFPIESAQCDYGIQGIHTENDLIACAKEGNDGVEISLIIDGINIDYPVEKNRIMTNLFNITMNNKMMGDYTGTFPSLSEGYSIFLKPMKPGNHSIIYQVSVVYPANPVNDYIQKVQYFFHVK